MFKSQFLLSWSERQDSFYQVSLLFRWCIELVSMSHHLSVCPPQNRWALGAKPEAPDVSQVMGLVLQLFRGVLHGGEAGDKTLPQTIDLHLVQLKPQVPEP